MSLARKIRFKTFGGTPDACDEVAREICLKALGHQFDCRCDGYTADVQTISNEVIVWRGEYTATSGGGTAA